MSVILAIYKHFLPAISQVCCKWCRPLTSIDHDAHHSLSVAYGAAPQQEVAVMEADTTPTGMLPAQHAHKHTLWIVSSCWVNYAAVSQTSSIIRQYQVCNRNCCVIKQFRWINMWTGECRGTALWKSICSPPDFFYFSSFVTFKCLRSSNKF